MQLAKSTIFDHEQKEIATLGKLAKYTMCGGEFEAKRTPEEKLLDGVAGQVFCFRCRDEAWKKAKALVDYIRGLSDFEVETENLPWERDVPSVKTHTFVVVVR